MCVLCQGNGQSDGFANRKKRQIPSDVKVIVCTGSFTNVPDLEKMFLKIYGSAIRRPLHFVSPLWFKWCRSDKIVHASANKYLSTLKKHINQCLVCRKSRIHNFDSRSIGRKVITNLECPRSIDLEGSSFTFLMCALDHCCWKIRLSCYSE